MQLDLTDTQARLLLELLQEHHKSMLTEIGRSDSLEYKEDLKRRFDEFEAIIAKLNGTVPLSQQR